MISVTFRQATTVSGTTYGVGQVATLDNAVAHDLVIAQAAKFTPRDFFPGPFVGGGAGAGSTVGAVTSVNGVLQSGKHTPVDATSGSRAMTLPVPTTNGQILSVEKADFTINPVNISGNIRGSYGVHVLTLPRETIVFLSKADGSWWQTAGQKTRASLDNLYLTGGSGGTGGTGGGGTTDPGGGTTDPGGGTNPGGGGTTNPPSSVGDGSVHVDPNDPSILVLEDGGPWTVDPAHPTRVLVSSQTWTTDPNDSTVVIVNYTPTSGDGKVHVDSSDTSILVLEDGGPWTVDPYHPSRVIVTSTTWVTDPNDTSNVLVN